MVCNAVVSVMKSFLLYRMANGEQLTINILKYGYSNEQVNAAAIIYLYVKGLKAKSLRRS